MDTQIFEPKSVEPGEIDLHEFTRELDRVKSRVFLGRNAAFLGSLMSSLEFIWSFDIPTAGTDGERFWWNPEDFLKCSPEERKATVEHELWHVARLHMVRCGARDPRIWNYACDIRINRDLRKEGYPNLGPPMWIPNHPEITSEVEEDIYDHLLQQAQSNPQMGQGQSQHMLPGKKNNAQTVINNVVKAIHQTKLAGQAGSLPGGIEETVKQFLAPVIPWQTVLHRFFSDLLDEDFTWKRPNRRFDPGHIYLPSRFTDDGRLEHLIYYLDVSGSISESDLIRFNSEVKYIKDTFNPVKLSLVQFDTRITDELVITENDQFEEIRIKGRGGTDLTPVREHIIESKPTAAIIFSDLYVSPMQPLPFEVPIIWVAVNNQSATVPFGQLIHIKG